MLKWPAVVPTLLAKAAGTTVEDTVKLMTDLRKTTVKHATELWQLTLDRRHEAEGGENRIRLARTWIKLVTKMKGRTDRKGNRMPGWVTVNTC